MSYEMKTGQFEGPLEKLLELIEAQQLEITEVSLSRVTDDFLKYIETLRDADFSLLADFISVASKLILIKSKALLPMLELTEEEEQDTKDLEARLRIYKELKAAMKLFQAAWEKGNASVSRPYLLNVVEHVRVFSPGNATVEELASRIGDIFKVFEKLERETETIKETIISLEEKIQEVVSRVTEVGETSLAKLSSTKSKSELVVLFLAVLHLAREQLIKLEQASHLSDIMITKN